MLVFPPRLYESQEVVSLLNCSLHQVLSAINRILYYFCGYFGGDSGSGWSPLFYYFALKGMI